MLEILPGIIVIGIGIILCIASVNLSKARKGRDEWFKEKSNSLNLDNNLNFILSNSICNNFLIYTKDRDLYVVNKPKKCMDKIELNDILNINVDLFSLEKNTKRLIALTSTYDKSVKLVGIDFKITTSNAVYVIPCMINGKDTNGSSFSNRNIILDEVNRCKLIIERDIENLKKSNI